MHLIASIFFNNLRVVQLRGKIQMCIQIRRCSDRTVAEVMEPDRPQVMPLEKAGKLLRHIVWLDDIILFVDADVVALFGIAGFLDP